MTYDEAIAKVKEKLLEYAKVPAGYQCSIYDYALNFSTKQRDLEQHAKDHPYCGIRVAEVSFSNASGGCSYMQVDVPWGIAVCAQTERVLLALVEGWDEDEIEEEYWRLEQCFAVQEKSA
jgi:hypothetical protein